ncbi:GNAT family N-acetyltransferase [Chryseobacterium oryctis]|uniref:Acetyltransferase n=1 Tax=Chryseobacterium oryctis TaxID=2952618 RepID=A0ABT3HKK0_9FLAO|nr:GNAT family N-acetyltransferase [Chryseobacterium oryctis]MCW3160296.1 acetyltransferase [Chryseobacterium oryctis]
MKNLEQLNTSFNLLLNLLVREQNNWYFIDIIPRYDEDLKGYMQSCEENDFIRFDAKDQIIYIPISFKSLTGMHIFADRIGLRKENFGEISILKAQEAVLILLQDSYPHLKESQLISFIETLPHTYDNAVKNQILNITPDLAKASKNENLKETGGIFLKNWINEYSSLDDLKEFSLLLKNYATKGDIGNKDATVKWLKNYTTCLLEKIAEEYFQNNKIVSPCLFNSKLFVSEIGEPLAIEFFDDSLSFHTSDITQYYNPKKIERFLQSQLLTFHLFPLIRSIALLGILEEKDLIKAVDDTILQFKNRNEYPIDFILHHKILVDNFLPSMMPDENSEHIFIQKHIHNHVINNRYYADELIKPKKDGLVHKRYFENSSMEIGIRAFNIETDLEILYDWVNQDYAKKFWEMEGPIEQLEEAYIKHLGVDYSHPYIGTLNGEPIFTLELYWAIKDEVGKYYPFQPGDYGFHMLIAPAKKRIKNFSYYALTMCMEHFFSYKQVKRMIGEASVEHQGTHNLITKVGCEFNKALKLPYKTSNLTFLNREMYQEAVEEVLEESCTDIYLKV